MEHGILSKKGQGIIEAAFVVIIVILLLGGIINIWIWANNQIVRRQMRYNQTRVAAGAAVDNYQLQWPVYRPEALGENKVLLDAP
jgi:hypothetical protein